MMPGGHPVRWEDSSLAVGVASILAVVVKKPEFQNGLPW